MVLLYNLIASLARNDLKKHNKYHYETNVSYQSATIETWVMCEAFHQSSFKQLS